MGFSDAATPVLWVGNIKAGLQQKDVMHVFSSFGAIRRIKLGPAPPGTSATGLAAEVHFASVAQAAAALTALNAIVVPRLSGHHPLAIQCWQPSGGPAASYTAPPVPAPKSFIRPATAPLSVPRPAAAAAAAAAVPTPAHAAAAAAGSVGPQPDVRPVNLAEASAAVELPGAEDLHAALAFFEGCSFLAVPEEERASTAKWAVLQALLARGLRHQGGCSFRQLAVPLTHVGDELLKHRGSNPAVEAEYQSYPAAGRLTSLVKDIQSPGLIRVHNEGTNANTHVVQLHLGRLALAGGAPGGGSSSSGGAGSSSGGGVLPPKQRPVQSKPPPPNQYTTSSTPSRHLVLLGVADRADVVHLAGIARQHGTLEKYLHNPRNNSLTMHFSTTEAALSMAREVEGQALPGLSTSDPLQVQYKHLVPASAAGTAGAAGQPKAPPAKAAVGQQAAAKAGKAKQEAPPAFQYSASQPSCSLRVKKLNSAVVSRQSLTQVGQSSGGSDFNDCTFYPSTGIGYMFFKTEAAASAAAAALRGGDLPWSQSEALQVEFRHPPDARLDVSTSAASAGAGAAKPVGAAGEAGAAAEEVPTCCACCGATGEGVALSRCSGCRVVHYCGRECQLKDWAPRHATECGQLQQLAAALQAAQPAAGGAQAQLLIAALRSPGGREAAMLRSLLGADALPHSGPADGDSTGSSASSGSGTEAGGTAAGAEEEQQPAGEAAGIGNGTAVEAGEAAASDDGAAATSSSDGAAAAGAAGESDAAGAGLSSDGPAAEAAAAAGEAAAGGEATAMDEAAAAAAAEGSTAAEPAAAAIDGSSLPAQPIMPAAAAGGSTIADDQQQPAEQAAASSDAAAAAAEPLPEQCAEAAEGSEDAAAAEATAASATVEEQPAAVEEQAAAADGERAAEGQAEAAATAREAGEAA